jgi:YggT family protein
MKLFFGIVAFVLYLYLLIVLARVIVEMTRQFARSWRPAGVAAIGIEVVYVATDPPVQALRRMVKPVRIGSINLDLSILILLLAILALQWAALSLA